MLTNVILLSGHVKHSWEIIFLAYCLQACLVFCILTLEVKALLKWYKKREKLLDLPAWCTGATENGTLFLSDCCQFLTRYLNQLMCTLVCDAVCAINIYLTASFLLDSSLAAGFSFVFVFTVWDLQTLFMWMSPRSQTCVWLFFPSFYHYVILSDCECFVGWVLVSFLLCVAIGAVGLRLGESLCCTTKINLFFPIQFIEGPFEEYLKCLENPQVW